MCGDYFDTKVRSDNQVCCNSCSRPSVDYFTGWQDDNNVADLFKGNNVFPA